MEVFISILNSLLEAQGLKAIVFESRCLVFKSELAHDDASLETRPAFELMCLSPVLIVSTEENQIVAFASRLGYAKSSDLLAFLLNMRNSIEEQTEQHFLILVR